MKINELFDEILLENVEYEFKVILSSENPIKWAKTIIAYANGDGGYIFVGVQDNRDVFGISLDDIDKMKRLVTLVNDRNIFPHVKIKYSLKSVDDNAEKFVLAIKVLPSDSVVRFKDGDFNEKVFVKGDASSLPASPEDIIALSKRKYGVDNSITNTIYEEEKWSKFILLCKEYRDDNSKPNLKELQNEEIVSKDNYVTSGFIMFSDDYSDDDSRIHCRLWKGIDKTGIVLDTLRYKGPIGEGFKNALTFIEKNTKIGWEKTPNGGRKELRSYPKDALTEALVNAIAHRDYSINGTQIDIDIYEDRIDITSPGSWLLPKPYENYPLGFIPSIRRNQIIAACLDVANLMERGGTGFQTIISCYKEANEDKQPVVLSYPGFIILRLFDLYFENKSEKSNNYELLNEEEKMVILALLDGKKTIQELQKKSSYSSRSYFIKKVINPLIERNYIKREGDSKSPKSYFVLN